MAQKAPFDTILNALQDDSTIFPASYLQDFSDISPENLKALLKVWPTVPTKRKHTLLEDLEDLVEMDTLTNFEDLAKALLKDDDPYVRIESIHLLSESDDKKLVPILLDYLNADPDLDVRAAAATGLGSFVYLGEIEEIPEELHHQIEDELLKTVDTGENVNIRRHALEALGFSSREEVGPLIEAAYKEKDTDWVVSAIFAMGRSSDDRWKKQVLSQLRAPDEDIRFEAIRAAGELELNAARASLLDQLEDEEDPDVRHQIIWSLSKIGGEGVRDRLDELLDLEEDDEEVEYLSEALDNLSFTEDTQFSIFDLEPGEDAPEEDLDEPDDYSS